MIDHLKVGSIITSAQRRDAIHVAIAPVKAVHLLRPGQTVTADGKSTSGKGVGIVDPFLRSQVKPGEMFWIFLYPGSITSLRHDWIHPNFGPEEPLSDSESWLRAYAQEVGIPYDMLLERHAGDQEGFMPVEEFWRHWEAVTGKDSEEEGRWFSCAC